MRAAASTARRAFKAVACVLAVAALTPRISLASDPFVYEVVKDYMYSLRTTLTVGVDGRVYGTTTGSVFRIDGTTITTLHTFVNEESPSPLVLGTNGSLYGLTNFAVTGTIDYCCTFFRIDAAGNYSSSVVPMPAHAISDLVRGGDGAFYAALSPSQCSLNGCAFPGGVGKITEAEVFTLLTGLNDIYAGEYGFPDGVPLAPGSDGLMYGTLEKIVGDGAPGKIVRWDAAGAESAIHSYTEAEAGGGTIRGFVLGSDGLLYAAAPYGGTGHGSVFRFDTAGNVTLLHQFNYTDGAEPSAPMTLGSDGAMYGVTSFGGAYQQGTVYRITPDGTFTSLFSLSIGDGADASLPFVLATNGVLYAPTESGWPLAGIVRVDPSAGTVNSSPLPSGVAPGSPLVQAEDGWLYGVARIWNPSIPNPDTAIYRITTPSAPAPVPSMSPAGFAALGLLMLFAGGYALRRRRG